MKPRFFIILTLLVGIVSSSGCLYRMDIEQGNRIDSEVISQLELGMSRRQVEFLLGEPAIIDLYHPDTWHYVYYIRLGEDLSEEKRLMSLEFDNDLLARGESSARETSAPRAKPLPLYRHLFSFSNPEPLFADGLPSDRQLVDDKFLYDLHLPVRN